MAYVKLNRRPADKAAPSGAAVPRSDAMGVTKRRPESLSSFQEAAEAATPLMPFVEFPNKDQRLFDKVLDLNHSLPVTLIGTRRFGLLLHHAHSAHSILRDEGKQNSVEIWAGVPSDTRTRSHTPTLMRPGLKVTFPSHISPHSRMIAFVFLLRAASCGDLGNK